MASQHTAISIKLFVVVGQTLSRPVVSLHETINVALTLCQTGCFTFPSRSSRWVTHHSSTGFEAQMSRGISILGIDQMARHVERRQGEAERKVESMQSDKTRETGESRP